jgi:hypothetical protein
MARERRVRIALLPALLAAAAAVAAAQVPPAFPPQFDLEKTLEAAHQTVRVFSERMRHELAVAIKADGAANAVPLCQTLSPDLSTGLSDESGFEVRRTSLKLRNPENAPEAWELEVLKVFQEKAASGADLSRLEHHELVVTAEGDRLFRFMKAIPTGDICLTCHGTEVKADVRAELTRYYPNDKATGYRLGELRGAFSLVKLIGE